MDVNEAIVYCLEQADMEYIFGSTGQVNASMLLALRESKKIQTVVVRNEQAASFMACGYSMFSQKLGVCFATGGPGAFNLFSGLAVAYSDSLPVLAITGYTSKNQRGKGALNESSGLSRTPDSHKMFVSTTKKSYIIERADDVWDIMEDAIKTAYEGRPGPVHIHVPKDITTAAVYGVRKLNLDIEDVLPKKENTKAFSSRLAEALLKGEKTALLIGYGCMRSQCQNELLELIDTYQIPFMSTMDAKGYISEEHPLSLGVFGKSGDASANEYWKEADVILALGNSFAENATFGFQENLLENKTLMHINIDRNELNKVYNADYAMAADCRKAIAAVLTELKQTDVRPFEPYTANKREKWYETPIPDYVNGKIHPGALCKALSCALPDNSIVMGDAGSHMLWLSAFMRLGGGKYYQNPGSFGPMASHTNGAIGVKCASPEKTVVSACGDGCYMMAGFELMTAVQNNIPVIWIIFNNGEFNVIKKFLLNMFNDHAYMEFNNPDYVKYAEACGADGFRVERLEDFVPAFKKAVSLNKPVLIDVIISGEVYAPMQQKL